MGCLFYFYDEKNYDYDYDYVGYAKLATPVPVRTLQLSNLGHAR